jgi:hypothetical protein
MTVTQLVEPVRIGRWHLYEIDGQRNPTVVVMKLAHAMNTTSSDLLRFAELTPCVMSTGTQEVNRVYPI